MDNTYFTDVRNSRQEKELRDLREELDVKAKQLFNTTWESIGMVKDRDKELRDLKEIQTKLVEELTVSNDTLEAIARDKRELKYVLEKKDAMILYLEGDVKDTEAELAVCQTDLDATEEDNDTMEYKIQMQKIKIKLQKQQIQDQKDVIKEREKELNYKDML